MVEDTQHREPRELRSYLLCSTAFHAGLIAFGSLSSCHATLPHAPISTAATLVSVEMEAREPSPTPPGGGSPAGARDHDEAAEKIAIHLAPVKAKQAKTSAPEKAVEPEALPAPDPVASAKDDDGERATRTAQEASERQHGVEMAAVAAAAAAAAYGTGPGSHGGPGGPGAGWAPPAIRGRVAFGNGVHGAFTGNVCFFPFGTRRIASIHECDYVATIYTDTFDIPERQYHDGFPGITERSEWFLIDYAGSFTVGEYGTYEFRLHSDDGSYLYIDDNLLIENDGVHEPRSRSGSAALFAGEHRLRLRYAQTTDRMALQLFVTGPKTGGERIFTPHL
jgi:hypothetical protein